MQANWDPPDHAGAYLHIKRLLDPHDVISPGEFITAPPVVDSERLVTVYESESAGRDHLSGNYPRIISFSVDGRFIFVRNTDRSAPARFRDSVECLRQDDTPSAAGLIDFSRGEPELSQPESRQPPTAACIKRCGALPMARPNSNSSPLDTTVRSGP